MAAELKKFTADQLERLPKNHPHRGFIKSVHDMAVAFDQASTRSGETVYVRTVDLTEQIQVGELINGTFLGNLPDEIPLEDIRCNLISYRHYDIERHKRFVRHVRRGPYANEWEEIYKGLTATQRNMVSKAFKPISIDSQRERYGIQTLGELRDTTVLHFPQYGPKLETLLRTAIAKRKQD